ncbi:MAG: hypothetical protein NTY77_08275 [Elusimicrobia bacterium]|nr:hypothetical protein [Elusimicrobiota bacterium]
MWRIVSVAGLLCLPALACAGQAPSFEDSVAEASAQLHAGFQAARQDQPRPAPPPAERCRPENEGEPKLYASDFHWSYSLPEMIQRSAEVYASDKRLPRRAYWNERAQRFELPQDAGRGGPVVLPESYIRSVARHIEAAFAQDYIDAVFFPDMGHSHLLIPEALWESKYDLYPAERFSQMYTDMFLDPGVETFYHTAEQLKTREPDGSLVADPRTQRRYRTRNIAGPNSPAAELRVLQNPDSSANTVGEVPGFHWWGAGFNISANRNGCFSYTAQGRTFFFDMSLYDLEPPPGAGGSDY